MGKTTRWFAAWIACLAILLASFAPSMAHAFAAKPAGADLKMEICSVMGTAHSQAAEGLDSNPSSDPSSNPAPTSHLEHCPFCLGHAGAATLPQGSGLILPAPQLTAGFPSLYYQAPRRLFIWSSARSRAPPAVV